MQLWEKSEASTILWLGWVWFLSPSHFLCWQKQVDSTACPNGWQGGASSDGPPLPTSPTESPATFLDGRCLTGELTWGRKHSFPQDVFQISRPNQSDGFWQANKISKADLQCKTQISQPLISCRETSPWFSQVRTKYFKYSWKRDYFPLIISEITPVLVKERHRYKTQKYYLLTTVI